MEFRRNSWTAVRHTDANCISLVITGKATLVGKRQHLTVRSSLPEVSAGTHANLATLRRELHGVVDQVGNYMLEFERIEKQRLEIAVWTELPPEFPLLEAVRPVFQDFRNALVHVSQLF